MPRIFLDDNKRWQLLIAAMNGAQQCHSVAIFGESRDSQIQLTPFLADDLQCIADSSGDEEDGIGAEKRLSCHRLDVGVACVEKRPPCLHG